MRALTLLTLLGATLAPGCNSSAPPPPVADVPIDPVEARYQGIDAAVRDRKGNVVLVDFWATWCGPCVKSFPHFVGLHKKYKDRGLACVGVSLDARGQREQYDRDAVLAFLQKHEATFAHFVLKGLGDDEERFAKRFGLSGGIPHQALFGRGGQLVWHSEQNDLTEAELSALIEAELGK